MNLSALLGFAIAVKAMSEKMLELKVYSGVFGYSLYDFQKPQSFLIESVGEDAYAFPQYVRPNMPYLDARGITTMKLLEMIVTGRPSGTVEYPFGSEGASFRGYRGGVCDKTFVYPVYVAFTGATEDLDVLIAQAGLEAVLKKL